MLILDERHQIHVILASRRVPCVPVTRLRAEGIDSLRPEAIDFLSMTLHSSRPAARTDLLQGTLDMLILRTLLWGRCMATASPRPSAPSRPRCCRWKPDRSIRPCSGWRSAAG